jgi:hypothetical protein
LIADVILVVHVLYALVVVLSVPLIVIGAFLHWQWVRNVWFRIIHLLMIAIVAAESLLGIACPLTVWERFLRGPTRADSPENADFIAHWLSKLLFWHFPPWVFTTIYVSFGAIVLSLLVFVPMRRRTAPSTKMK